MQLESFIMQEGENSKRYKIAQKPHYYEQKSLEHLRYFSKQNASQLKDFSTSKNNYVFSVLKDAEPKKLNIPRITDVNKNIVVGRSKFSGYKMGLAVLMKHIRVDHITQHLFQKTVMGTNWMVDLNMGEFIQYFFLLVINSKILLSLLFISFNFKWKFSLSKIFKSLKMMFLLHD